MAELPSELWDIILQQILRVSPATKSHKNICRLILISSYFNEIIKNNRNISNSINKFKKYRKTATLLAESCCLGQFKYLNIKEIKTDLMKELEIFKNNFNESYGELNGKYSDDDRECIREDIYCDWSEPFYNILNIIRPSLREMYEELNSALGEIQGDHPITIGHILCRFIGIPTLEDDWDKTKA